MSQEGSKQLFWTSDAKARYLKWEIVAAKYNSQDDSYMQISELRFINKDTNVFQWPSDIECIDHSDWLTTPVDGYWRTKAQGGECSENLFDGSVYTKFTTKHLARFPFCVTFDLKSDALDLGVFNRYQWYTANDDTSFQNRTPTSWNMYVSKDALVWNLLDHVEDFTAPIANYTLAYTSNCLS